MTFLQSAPHPGDPFRDDPLVAEWIARALPAPVAQAIAGDLAWLGAHSARAWEDARSRTPATPVLTRRDAWGQRVDRIELTPAWRDGFAIAARRGLVAAGHDPAHGAFARADQFLRVFLYHVASEFFTCPLAMSDGAATALKAAGNAALVERALPHLLARERADLWLSGQWMTETAGGSDVGRTATIASRGPDGHWRLHGRKWFTSAIVGEMALTLARPEGAGDGADALALFFLETRDGDGNWNGVRIDRLKDKLGTRELPTAEIHLCGTLAEPVAGLAHGVRAIAPMLNVTRTWNAVCAVATMRRCVALALDYARRREAFGGPIIDKPLHRRALAAMAAESEAAFHFVFDVACRLGRVEAGAGDAADTALLRLLTPLAKAWTGRMAVRIASDTCEAFGGAGYIEDTGIPQLLRDAQVFPIWEGTTDVLALDALRVLAATGLEPLRRACAGLLAEAGDEGADVLAAIERVQARLEDPSPQALEADARGIAMTLARVHAAALLARHAAWSTAAGHDTRARAALAAFRARGLQRLDALPMDAAGMLVDNTRSYTPARPSCST